MEKDLWKNRSDNMKCKTCMYFVPKIPFLGFPEEHITEDELSDEELRKAASKSPVYHLGRCRRHAPAMNGWPVMFVNDDCGDHKLDENKFRPA